MYSKSENLIPVEKAYKLLEEHSVSEALDIAEEKIEFYFDNQNYQMMFYWTDVFESLDMDEY